jgi:hypothetical protein
MTGIMDPQTIANEFLRQWRKAHLVGGRPDYDVMADRFAIFSGEVSADVVRDVGRVLHAERIKRGWPGPRLNEPSIEEVIVDLWTVTLRLFAARRRRGTAS